MTDQTQRSRASDAAHVREPSQLTQPVDNDPTIETPVEARGGFLGKPVAVVLVVSLVLVVLAGIAVGYIPL